MNIISDTSSETALSETVTIDRCKKNKRIMIYSEEPETTQVTDSSSVTTATSSTFFKQQFVKGGHYFNFLLQNSETKTIERKDNIYFPGRSANKNNNHGYVKKK